MVHIFRTCPKLLWELQNLPHAAKGNPEDADTAAPDHAMDAGRYLFLNIGGGPQFLKLPEHVDTSSRIAPLPMLGRFAYRPADDAPEAAWDADDDAPVRGATQVSPFA
jgi:hypothetical protein